MTREAKSSIIQNVIASLIVQALALGGFMFVFYGKLEAKLSSYDASIAQNVVDHGALSTAIDDINRNGTIRGQPIYSDMAEIKTRVSAMERRSAADDIRFEWIMASLERLERQNGLTPQPRPRSSSP